MSSQHSQLSIVPGIGRPEDPDPSDSGYEPTIGLKAVAKILNCSASTRPACATVRQLGTERRPLSSAHWFRCRPRAILREYGLTGSTTVFWQKGLSKL
jgi:hypothetical protein